MNNKTYFHNRIISALLVVLSISIIIFSTGCIGFRPSSTKSAQHLYQTFFVGAEGIQYFIKPLSFSNDKKAYLDIDMTFRYKNELRDSVTVNLSFYNNEVIKQIDSLQISNGANAIVLKDLKYMFAQRRKNDYNLRFNNRALLKSIYSLFISNQWTVRLYTQGKMYVYTPTKSTKKAIPSLNTHIFSTF